MQVPAEFPKLSRDEIYTLMKFLWNKPKREFQILGYMYARNNIKVLMGASSDDGMESLECTKTLIITKSWWDTVDMLASNSMYMYLTIINFYIIYSGASLIRTPVWEPIPIHQQKVTHLSGNSVIRTAILGTEQISEVPLYFN